jgi:hypothetical protein
MGVWAAVEQVVYDAWRADKASLTAPLRETPHECVSKCCLRGFHHDELAARLLRDMSLVVPPLTLPPTAPPAVQPELSLVCCFLQCLGAVPLVLPLAVLWTPGSRSMLLGMPSGLSHPAATRSERDAPVGLRRALLGPYVNLPCWKAVRLATGQSGKALGQPSLRLLTPRTHLAVLGSGSR